MGRLTMNLGSVLIKSARQHRLRAALWSKGAQLTYGALFERASGIAQALANAGIGPGDRVAILSDRTLTAYTCIVATLLCGAAYVPLNPRFPVHRNRQILIESGACALLCDDRHRAIIGELTDDIASLRLLAFPEGETARGETALAQLGVADLTPRSLDLPAPCEQACGELAYVFFTSGSTGTPKGVPISHGNVFAYLEGIRSICSITEQDRLLQLVDLTFDLSVHDMFLCWTSGACLYSVPENAVLLCTRFVVEQEITAWLSVPSTAGLIKQSGLLEPASMHSLRHTFFCGEALTGAVAEAWAEAAPNSRIDNIYGPTEATVAFSSFQYQPGQELPPAVVPLGQPFPGQHMALFSDEGEEQLEFGEICLAGSQVMEGYWQDPAMSAKRMFDANGLRWYRTGDLGRYDKEQGFLYAGRADHQVKIRGYRVELQEIEHVVRETSGSDLVAVLPWSETPGGPAVGCAAFALHPKSDEDRIIAACRERLPEYMVPNRVFAVAEIPFNANGKVDYVALRSHPMMAQLAERGKR